MQQNTIPYSELFMFARHSRELAKHEKTGVFAKMVELNEQTMLSFQLVKGMEMEICFFFQPFFINKLHVSDPFFL